MSKEPRSIIGRYAFGYSDQKPGLVWWVIHLAMVGYVLCLNRPPLPASDETINEEHDDCANDGAN